MGVCALPSFDKVFAFKRLHQLPATWTIHRGPQSTSRFVAQSSSCTSGACTPTCTPGDRDYPWMVGMFPARVCYLMHLQDTGIPDSRLQSLSMPSLRHGDMQSHWGIGKDANVVTSLQESPNTTRPSSRLSAPELATTGIDWSACLPSLLVARDAHTTPTFGDNRSCNVANAIRHRAICIARCRSRSRHPCR